VKVFKHATRHYDPTRKLKWVDRAGERSGRLLCVEWVGYYQGPHKTRRPFWRCRCDCGREVIIVWQPGNTLSCGCRNREAQLRRDFRNEMPDGTWRLKKAEPLKLPDGRSFKSGRELARAVGISDHAMRHRMEHWPIERWTEPGMPRGVGGGQKHRLRLMKEKAAVPRTPLNKPQPWSFANLKGASFADPQWLARKNIDLKKKRKLSLSTPLTEPPGTSAPTSLPEPEGVRVWIGPPSTRSGGG